MRRSDYGYDETTTSQWIICLKSDNRFERIYHKRLEADSAEQALTDYIKHDESLLRYGEFLVLESDGEGGPVDSVHRFTASMEPPKPPVLRVRRVS